MVGCKEKCSVTDRDQSREELDEQGKIRCLLTTLAVMRLRGGDYPASLMSAHRTAVMRYEEQLTPMEIQIPFDNSPDAKVYLPAFYTAASPCRNPSLITAFSVQVCVRSRCTVLLPRTNWPKRSSSQTLKY
jgi:hypothetical protein